MSFLRSARITLARFLLVAPLLQPAFLHALSEDFIIEEAPRLESLFSSLDPLNPGIGSIVELWHGGQQFEAAEGLAQYFKDKDLSLEFFGPPYLPAGHPEQAEAALENRFLILDQWLDVPVTEDGAIEWEYRGGKGDKEVAWMLNRHAILPILSEAYRETGDTRYKARLNQIWTDWITSNTYPDRLSFSPSWRALEVARRILNSWMYAFYEYKSLEDETILLVLSSIVDHADSLHEHPSFWGGNHLISEKLALLALAWAWPEFEGASEWQDDALSALEKQFLGQTYPDGSYKELSNHYQRVVLVNATLFWRLLASLDPDHKSRPVSQRIEKMWEFFIGSMKPDGSGPLNNASDEEWNAGLTLKVWEEFGRDDWRYKATGGKQGKPSTESPSLLFPYAGQAFIRNKWAEDGDWIYFDAGPYGTAHQHKDRLHVSAYLKGNPVLVDNGRFTYQPGKWNAWFKSPQSHNVLLLDGHPVEQAPHSIKRPLPIIFNEDEDYVFTSARARYHRGAKYSMPPPLRSPVSTSRSILYDKRGFALILDHLLTFDAHRLTASWNFHPDIPPEETGNFLKLAAAPSLFKSSVHIGSESDPIGGFHSTDYNRKVPSPRLVFNGTIKSPSTLVWILQDIENPPLTVNVLSKPGNKVIHFIVLEDGQQIAEARIQLHPEPELLEYLVD